MDPTGEAAKEKGEERCTFFLDHQEKACTKNERMPAAQSTKTRTEKKEKNRKVSCSKNLKL
jgi:hypothetical protein